VPCPVDRSCYRFDVSFEHPDYADVQPLAKGGQAVVFRARHVPLDRHVAVKVLRDAGDKETVERLLQEARLVARLRHPNLVQVYDAGTLSDGRAYVVMECVEGSTLQSMAGPLPAALAVRLVAQVAGALGVAHEVGVVHRDVKPSNILLEGDASNPVAKLADFGIAHVEDSDITHTGVALGTPSYMAPEGFRGESAPESDVYALGLILHLLLTGKRPFEANSAIAWMGQHLSEDRPELPEDLDIPVALRDLHRSMVALEPQDRPPDGRAVAQVLAAVLAELEPTLAVPLRTPSTSVDPPTDTVSVGWLGLGAAALTTGGVLLAAGTLLLGVGVGAALMHWSDDAPQASVQPGQAPAAAPTAVDRPAPEGVEEPALPPADPEPEAAVDAGHDEGPAEPVDAPAADAPRPPPATAAARAVAVAQEPPSDDGVAEAAPAGPDGGEAPGLEATSSGEDAEEAVDGDGPSDPPLDVPADAMEAVPAPEPAPAPVFAGGTFRGEASGRPVVLRLSGGAEALSGELEVKVGAQSENRHLVGQATSDGATWRIDMAESGGGWTVTGRIDGSSFTGTVGLGGKRTLSMEASK